jgi:hypothetical protein
VDRNEPDTIDAEVARAVEQRLRVRRVVLAERAGERHPVPTIGNGAESRHGTEDTGERSVAATLLVVGGRVGTVERYVDRGDAAVADLRGQFRGHERAVGVQMHQQAAVGAIASHLERVLAQQRLAPGDPDAEYAEIDEGVEDALEAVRVELRLAIAPPRKVAHLAGQVAAVGDDERAEQRARLTPSHAPKRLERAKRESEVARTET